MANLEINDRFKVGAVYEVDMETMLIFECVDGAKILVIRPCFEFVA